MTRMLSLLSVTLLGLLLAFALWSDSSRLILEKVATNLAMPYGLCWLLSIVACLSAWHRGDRQLLRICLVVSVTLYLGGNGAVSKLLMRSLEREYLMLQPLSGERFDVVILLGGGTGVRPGMDPQLGASGDRVFLAAEMYHAGKAARIICTGTRIEGLSRNDANPGDLAIELLQRVGVPKNCLTYVAGRTTSEEMQHLSMSLANGEQVGLITSAWHMRRATRLARAQGLDVTPLPSDFRSPHDIRPTILDWIPDSLAADNTRVACKEWLARLVGR